MAKEDNYYDILGGYLRQGEPQQAEKAANWGIAIGLQAVDGLTPSDYLMDTARRNIEGEITISEVKQLLKSYYDSKTTRTPDDNEKEEADKVSSNIQELLSHRTLTFNVVGVTGTHEAIFNGVFKHAGKIRDYNISKKEFVLRGESVAYMEYDWLRRALEYDLQQERDFDYKGLSKDEIIQHLCRFTAGLWEIHPFCEGNTRTTAVFLIQYLRSMGFDVNNDPFARHSWYFRNALVRANYSNPLKGVSRDYSFLEKFFRNLLLGENNELKNRYMVICPPEELSSPDKLPDTPTDKLPDILPRNLDDKFETNNENIIKVVKAIGKNELSVRDMLKVVGLKDRENFMNNMLNPAMKEGFVRMLHPESPRHPRQKYLLTVKGMGLYSKKGMKLINNIKEKLQYFVENNEVVYQFCGELIEVSNDKEKENKETLLGYFRRANRVEVYTKHDSLAKNGWTELADWSTDDDVLFLLDGVGVLICIPKKEATANNLIEA